MKQVLRILVTLLLLFNTALAQGDKTAPAGGLADLTILDLQTAQRIALKDNPGIHAATARIEQAKARVKQAMAAWWPSIDLNGSLSRTRRSDYQFEQLNLYPASSGQSIDRTYDSSSAAIQATWVLFDGFARSFQQKQQQLGEQSIEQARRNSQRLLLSAVAEAFFNAQLTQTKVKIAEADKAFYMKQLKDANNRYEVGTGAWGDVLNIKVQLNSAKTNLLLSKREYEAALYGIAALMGIPHAIFPQGLQLAELDNDFKPSDELEKNIKQKLELALSTRPDLKKITLEKQAAEEATGQAKAGFWPRVQLGGSINGSHQGDYSLSEEDIGNSLSLTASWNLFSGGADQAKIREAEQKRREIAHSMADLRNTIASEIRQDVALLAAAREQVQLQRASVLLVEENRKLAESEYEAGATSLVRLNEAQRDLTTTYNRLAQSLVGYHQARQRLLTATGQILVPFTSAEAAPE